MCRSGPLRASMGITIAKIKTRFGSTSFLDSRILISFMMKSGRVKHLIWRCLRSGTRPKIISCILCRECIRESQRAFARSLKRWMICARTNPRLFSRFISVEGCWWLRGSRSWSRCAVRCARRSAIMKITSSTTRSDRIERAIDWWMRRLL